MTGTGDHTGTVLDRVARLLRAHAWLRPLFLGVFAIGLGIVVWTLVTEAGHLVAGLLTALWGLLGFSIAATLPFVPPRAVADAGRWARFKRRTHRGGYGLLALMGAACTLFVAYLSLRLPFVS
ncbi:MAG: hypothetical protein AAF515_13490 [Pseudomonadota bacterium]